MFCGALLLQPDFSCRATQGSVPVRKQRGSGNKCRGMRQKTHIACVQNAIAMLLQLLSKQKEKAREKMGMTHSDRNEHKCMIKLKSHL